MLLREATAQWWLRTFSKDLGLASTPVVPASRGTDPYLERLVQNGVDCSERDE
uniref:Uncharacterized protein n=1 Tax=Hyaloperonospora arabidopsidis (strain Emoy2) TaxID=559515 RepID=M4BPX5_HYAAE